MILLSHPTGNNFSRALATGLLEAHLLGRFVTSIAVKKSDWKIQCLPGGLRSELLRRQFDIPDSLISTHPWTELGRLTAQKLKLRFLTRQETGPFCADAVYRSVDLAVSKSLRKMARTRHLSGVYCYEDGALHTFEAAQQHGLRRYYDLPIAYWEESRRLMEEELERLPAWKITMEAIKDSRQKQSRKSRELELADAVICPSKFVYDTLPAAIRNTRPCIIAPFGSPPGRPLANPPRRQTNAPMRVLFAGSMSQRKGLADVFSAMKLVKRTDVQLVVFGSPIAPMPFYRREFPDFLYEAPRSHSGVLDLMQTCDVLLLPSIVEGRALVQQEAMSCGLPLIITPNTGGEDLIDEGETGFLVPIRSPEIIAEKIHWFADHRAELEAMREHARIKAASLTWTGYARTIIQTLKG